MASSLNRQLLGDALALSEQIKSLAAAGDWDAVNRLDRERMLLLKECLDAGVPDADKDFAVKTLQQIESMTAEVFKMAQNARVELQSELKLFHKQREAAEAYSVTQQN